MTLSKGLFIVGANRTPFCKYGGPLRELPASHAFAATAKDAIQTANIDPKIIDCTIVGNINFLSQCDGGKTPRYCGLYSGVPIERPALGVNRTCSSGLQALITGATEIITNTAKTCLVGGTEIMSSLPLLVRNVRFGTTLGTQYVMEDYIKKEFPDSYTGMTSQKMAEEVAKRRNITREVIDNFAVESHLKWKKAQDNGIFGDEITTLKTSIKNREYTISVDENPNPNINVNELATTSPILENGNIITSSNSAVPADGAASLIITNEEILKTHNLTPLARVTGWSSIGVDPLDVSTGAVLAIKRLIDRLKIRIEDIDLFEINEVFASHTISAIKDLDIDEEIVNVSGGALALGHPVSATGARMTVHAAHHIRSRGINKVIIASSCGSGQGIAVMLERV